MESWYVTFGPDHVLRGGQVRQEADPAMGGISLGGFFAVIPADTAAQARAKVIELFGPGNWCEIYPRKGTLIAMKYELEPLFPPSVTSVIARMPMCGCREPQHPHCPGWHTDVEG